MHDIVITNILPELRARKKITQDGLANAVGVTRQTIISIEKGTYTPSLPLALSLARFFELPVESIFTISSH
jgi:putative transcriptional regulator